MSLSKSTQTAIAGAISRATGTPFAIEKATPVGGGSINDSYAIGGSGQRYFLKLNRADRLAMFESEALGLRAIRATNTIHAPKPICCGKDAGHSFLVLEHLELTGANSATQEKLGQSLAAMHRKAGPYFGWQENNTIGSTPQINDPAPDWVAFYTQHRLGFQLELARQNGASHHLIDSGQRLQQGLGRFFSTYEPQASLLHGDLWGGNWGSMADGRPVIFDPACYYGDREADLAMTELFGGFGDRFYQSYVSAWAIDPGYQTRKVLYNLYHLLNHYNLFGGGYAAQAQGMIDTLLAEIS